MPLITPDAVALFSALLAAHMIGDFVLQTKAMVTHKRKPAVLLAHVLVHAVLTLALLGGGWQIAVAVALSHLVIDAVKTYALPRHVSAGFTAFLGDQMAHIAALIAIAATAQTQLPQPLFPSIAPLPAIYLLAASAIAAVLAGGHAVGALTNRFAAHFPQTGLPEAGRLIGQLERALIFLLILVGEPAAIGFLIAAKSILRFNDASEDQKTAEYVIVGTLASFLWALLCAYATLPLLEIVTNSP
ncbi:DUF3307 domain-containing protein [Sagittula sp. SSi028]|uniref:DUF3307 domain-containing protein n=1 Tax=Sagittula sp. SSi028 TaxID=3400636 RepID=UPI003AF48884